MLKKLLYVLILVPLLNACSTTLTTMVGEKREPVKTEVVKIYKEAPNGYKAIAEMSKKTNSANSMADVRGVEDTLEALKTKASELGANGILLESIDNVTRTSWVPGGNTSSPEYRHYKLVKVVAIHVPE